MKKLWILMVLFFSFSVSSAENIEQNLQNLLKLSPNEFRELIESNSFNPNLQDKNQNTLLHHAALLERELHMESLIEVGADLLKRNNKNQIPLDVLKESGADKDVIEFVEKATEIATYEKVIDLVNAGANVEVLKRWNVNAGDEFGNRPLFYFIIKGDIKAIENLIKAGVDLSLTDKEGDNALHKVAEEISSLTNEKIIRWLIRLNRMNLHSADNFGYTPLHVSALTDQKLKIGKIFFEEGARLNTEHHSGETPLDSAEKLENKKTIQFLKSQGARNGCHQAFKPRVSNSLQ